MKIIKQNYFKITLLLTSIIIFSNCNLFEKNKENVENQIQEEITEPEVVDVSYNKDLTDIALFIAGITPDSTSNLFKLSQTTEFQTYSKRINEKWDSFFNEVDTKIKPWKDKEIGNLAEKHKTLFYPFSGPDFINAEIFFPDFENYILFGLEPPGSVPKPLEIANNQLSNYFKMYEQSIIHIIQLSFFRTLSMENDLSSMEVDGTTPVLMIFLARSGKKIIDIKPFKFAENGDLDYDTVFNNFKGNNKFKNGIEISFRKENDPKVQKLIYFSVNISDDYLAKNTDVTNYLSKIDTSSAVYLKSASYLLHESYFSKIRNTILDKADFIFQDDSGLPYRFLNNENWDVKLYGVYDKPISLFSNSYQKDLFEAYQQSKSQELNFKRGYARKSNLLISRKKV